MFGLGTDIHSNGTSCPLMTTLFPLPLEIFIVTLEPASISIVLPFTVTVDFEDFFELQPENIMTDRIEIKKKFFIKSPEY